VRGNLDLVGCPCQKSPSTNTHTRFLMKTKSGLPKIAVLRRHPRILCCRIIATSRRSVVALPLLFIRDIIHDRRALLTWSKSALPRDFNPRYLPFFWRRRGLGAFTFFSGPTASAARIAANVV
jgi:hypothetical protein